MSATERLLFEIAATPQIKADRKWLAAFVKNGVCNKESLDILDRIHWAMINDTKEYLASIKEFEKGAACPISEIYVVRLLSKGKRGKLGEGVNIGFLPKNKDSYDFVEKYYKEQNETLDIPEARMPLNIFMSLTYSTEDSYEYKMRLYTGISFHLAGIFRLEEPKLNFELPKLPE